MKNLLIRKDGSIRIEDGIYAGSFIVEPIMAPMDYIPKPSDPIPTRRYKFVYKGYSYNVYEEV